MQQHPAIVLNWGAMVAAMIGCFVFGGLWYGPIAGKAWAKAMSFPSNFQPKPGEMKRAFAIQIVGLFLTVYVLAHTSQVWRPSVWGENVGMAGTVRRIHRLFMGSASHRSNILRSGFGHAGIGVVSKGGRVWATVMFYGG